MPGIFRLASGISSLHSRQEGAGRTLLPQAGLMLRQGLLPIVSVQLLSAVKLIGHL